MNLPQGTKIVLATGEIFVLDNEMKTSISCTDWDVNRFEEEGLISEVRCVRLPA